MGFDGLFFGRADYQDIINRFLKKDLEMVWKANQNLGQYYLFIFSFVFLCSLTYDIKYFRINMLLAGTSDKNLSVVSVLIDILTVILKI